MPGCKSQDSVGEIGTVIWVGKRFENTDFRQGTARRIIPISPTESWDLQPGGRFRDERRPGVLVRIRAPYPDPVGR